MHESVLEWTGLKVAEYGLSKAGVLEVGSRNINGSVREFFHGPYVGVDMLDGPGVDRVADAHELPFTDDSFDVVISTEMLEHDSAPWLSVSEMARVAHRYVLLTARGYNERACFPVHGYPDDFWRYSPGGMVELCKWAGLKPLEVVSDPQAPGVFCLAEMNGAG